MPKSYRCTKNYVENLGIVADLRLRDDIVTRLSLPLFLPVSDGGSLAERPRDALAMSASRRGIPRGPTRQTIQLTTAQAGGHSVD